MLHPSCQYPSDRSGKIRSIEMSAFSAMPKPADLSLL